LKRFGREVELSIKAARDSGAKVSIFDDNGCLLWFCQGWEGDVGNMEAWREALGRGWLEFIHHDDLPQVTGWIAAGDGAIVKFRSVAPDGAGWQTVVLRKRRVGLYWLAVGERAADPASGFVIALLLIQQIGSISWARSFVSPYAAGRVSRAS
jgi:hypothetical protein